MAQAQGRSSESEAWFQQAWQASSPRTSSRASVANNLGMLLRSQENSPRAREVEPLLRAAAADFATSKGEEALDTLRAKGNLGDHLRASGRLSEALPLLTAAVTGMQGLGSSAKGDLLIGESNLALLLYRSARAEESESWYRLHLN